MAKYSEVNSGSVKQLGKKIKGAFKTNAGKLLVLNV